ncbi:hypothetical protein E4T39_07775 [Aureobasidium subglaciale]|nr:hypothetical protein E4T39_07775 [Aureobasidium subglaciale]
MASSSTTTGCSSMPSNITFGLEYELKLRLTVDQLKQEIRSNVKVVTNPGEVRLSKVGPQYLQNDYRNFAFLDPNSSAPRTSLVTRADGQASLYRGYSTEALSIMQKRLQSTPGLGSVSIYQGVSKQSDFSAARLHLTHDASLNGLTKSAKIATGLCTPEQAETTDFVGTEIVTAPHSSPREACDEVNRISAALRSDGLDYIVDDECAMHVHVGQKDGTPFSVRTLPNLAYLTLIYEHEFARMTIPRKRGTDFETLSNRVDFATECPSPTEHHAYICDQAGNISEGSVEAIWNYQSLSEIRKALFDGVDSAAVPLEAFSKLLGSKGRMVNFSYCSRDITKNEPAATVEFRQHQGTLEGDDVFHWARHCTALVALAERCAINNTRCSITNWDDTIDIEQLWREMVLPESTKQFYRDRIQSYDERWPDVHQTPLCEPDMVFDDDSSFSDEESEDSEPSMTETEVQEKC